MPWHTYPFNPREVCIAADRGTLIRTLLAAGFDIKEEGDYLHLPNHLALDPYTGRWWIGLGDMRLEGGTLHPELPINERVTYLRELCFPGKESAA
jgi:hypothetical protein